LSTTSGELVTLKGDLMRVIHVLAQDVGVLGIFSDWAAQ
jgi:hypothetical protein